LIGLMDMATVMLDVNACAIASPLQCLLRLTHHLSHLTRIVPFQFRHNFAK
jgi:hypothetical protein